MIYVQIHIVDNQFLRKVLYVIQFRSPIIYLVLWEAQNFRACKVFCVNGPPVRVVAFALQT